VQGKTKSSSCQIAIIWIIFFKCLNCPWTENYWKGLLPNVFSILKIRVESDHGMPGSKTGARLSICMVPNYKQDFFACVLICPLYVQLWLPIHLSKSSQVQMPLPGRPPQPFFSPLIWMQNLSKNEKGIKFLIKLKFLMSAPSYINCTLKSEKFPFSTKF
jgi:hypothetical protein